MDSAQHQVVVGSDQFTYTGSWTRLPTPSGRPLTGTYLTLYNRASAFVSFTGTNITLFGAANPGSFWCLLDYVELPIPTPTAASPLSPLCQASGLSNSNHSLRLIGSGGPVQVYYATYASSANYKALSTNGVIIKVPNADTDIKYHGDWAVTETALRTTNYSTARLTFPFIGSQIGWYTHMDVSPYTSSFALNCTVDGVHPQSTTITTTTPIIPHALFITDPLPMANHELQCIYNTLGANAIPLTLDYLFVIPYAVTSPSSTPIVTLATTYPGSDSLPTSSAVASSDSSQTRLIRQLVGIIGGVVLLTAVFAFCWWRRKRSRPALPFHPLPITKERDTPFSTPSTSVLRNSTQTSRTGHLPEPELRHHPFSIHSIIEQPELQQHPFSTPSTIQLHRSFSPTRQSCSSSSLQDTLSSTTPSISSSAVYASTLPISQYSNPFADNASTERSESLDDHSSSRFSSTDATSVTKPSPLPQPSDRSQALKPSLGDFPPLYSS